MVYKLDPGGRQTVLHSFGFEAGYPVGGVIADAAGNLYGTTYTSSSGGAGAVYKLDTAGHATLLHTFTGLADGGNPRGSLTRDAAGNLYGTTFGGGSLGFGLVYKLDTAGNETVLFNFTGEADGGNPQAGVIRDSAGNLYGTTSFGRTVSWGTVYKLDPAGHATVLHSFTGGADGGRPQAELIGDSAGNLYGTTNSGGLRGTGVVFQLRR